MAAFGRSTIELQCLNWVGSAPSWRFEACPLLAHRRHRLVTCNRAMATESPLWPAGHLSHKGEKTCGVDLPQGSVERLGKPSPLWGSARTGRDRRLDPGSLGGVFRLADGLPRPQPLRSASPA